MACPPQPAAQVDDPNLIPRRMYTLMPDMTNATSPMPPMDVIFRGRVVQDADLADTQAADSDEHMSTSDESEERKEAPRPESPWQMSWKGIDEDNPKGDGVTRYCHLPPQRIVDDYDDSSDGGKTLRNGSPKRKVPLDVTSDEPKRKAPRGREAESSNASQTLHAPQLV